MIDCALFERNNQKPPSTDHSRTHPFRSSALQYYSLGLPVIPCAGQNGKIAQVKWGKYQSVLPHHKEVTSWISHYPVANIGLITGEVSGLTIVDIDTGKPQVIQQMIDHFGDTPVKVGTPSGGMHLYYQHNGEASHTGIEGLPVDIRSNGGYVIAPPSVNPATQRGYTFTEGSLSRLGHLPRLRKNALPKTPRESEPDILEGAVARQGHRNSSLFKALLDRARECATLDDLEDCAYMLNEVAVTPPLEQDEVQQIITNIWRLKIENRLFGGGERFLTVISSEIDALIPAQDDYIRFVFSRHRQRATARE